MGIRCNNINRLINETFHAEFKHQVDKKKASEALGRLLSQYRKAYTSMEGV